MRGTARCLILLALLPAAAGAHVFSQPYFLPVPFALYAWGATAALLVSFALVGLFAALPRLVAVPGVAAASVRVDDGSGGGLPVGVGRVASVGLLGLCIATGLAGSQNAFANISMTLFWIVFVLALPYAVAIAGDFYAPVNPWRALVDWLEDALGIAFTGRLRDPARFGTLPALVLYLAFIWLELFGQLLPRGLALALVAYTLVNLGGAWLFGKHTWFQRGEFFGIMLRLLGAMSPNARPWGTPAAPGRPRWRAPFVGLLEMPVAGTSLVLFILFMLSSTAFDGLHSSLPWVTVYWKTLYPAIAPWLTPAPGRQFILSTQIYYVWQWLSLLASPFVYLAVFAGCVALVKAVTQSTLPLAELVRRFAMSLVPIAFVYHVTHYYTVLLSQGVQLERLVSDPFGFGWNLFGTARTPVPPVMIGMGSIWLTQLALILAGHIVGVWLAHLEALRLFGSSRTAALSQLPMLVLMVVFTNFGLWILSLPISPGS